MTPRGFIGLQEVSQDSWHTNPNETTSCCFKVFRCLHRWNKWHEKSSLVRSCCWWWTLLLLFLPEANRLLAAAVMILIFSSTPLQESEYSMWPFHIKTTARSQICLFSPAQGRSGLFRSKQWWMRSPRSTQIAHLSPQKRERNLHFILISAQTEAWHPK